MMVMTGASGSAVRLQSPHQVATAEQGVQPARPCIHVCLCQADKRPAKPVRLAATPDRLRL